MADVNTGVCMFSKIPEEIVEEILCYLWSSNDQFIARLVCSLWNRLLLRIRQQRHQIFLNAIKTKKLYWQKYRNKARKCPSPRFSHSSCVLGGNLCIFGGCSSSNTVYNDLYIFNLMDREWLKPTTSGFAPVPRECATLVPYRRTMVLFGGCCQPPRSSMHLDGKFFNDVQVFNFQEISWSSSEECGSCKPCGRAGHSASVVGDTMVVFGGAQREKRFQDIWCYNLKTNKWLSPQVTGRKPNERFGQSQITVDDRSIVIVGGCGLSNTIYSDVWLLDVQGWTWREIEVHNRIYAAPQLWSHPAVMVEDSVLVFASPSRTREISSTAALMTGIPQARMQIYSMDCSELITNHRCSWQPVLDDTKSTSASSLHSIDVCEDMILIFGGLSNREAAQTANNSLIFVTPFWSDK